MPWLILKLGAHMMCAYGIHVILKRKKIYKEYGVVQLMNYSFFDMGKGLNPLGMYITMILLPNHGM